MYILQYLKLNDSSFKLSSQEGQWSTLKKKSEDKMCASQFMKRGN